MIFIEILRFKKFYWILGYSRKRMNFEPIKLMVKSESDGSQLFDENQWRQMFIPMLCHYFANGLPMFCQYFANILPMFCQCHQFPSNPYISISYPTANPSSGWKSIGSTDDSLATGIEVLIIFVDALVRAHHSDVSIRCHRLANILGLTV